MKRIFVCSPFRGDGSPEAYARNRELAIGYGRQVLAVGLVPVVPHAYWPLFLDDADAHEREIGMALGRLEMATCAELWYWVPDGVKEASEGMDRDMDEAERYGLTVANGPDAVARYLEQIGTRGPYPHMRAEDLARSIAVAGIRRRRDDNRQVARRRR